MECKQVAELLTAFVDGELDWRSSAIVQQHLAVCGRCCREYRLEQQTKALLRRTIAPAKTPDDIADRLNATLFAECLARSLECCNTPGHSPPWSLRIRKTLYIAGSTVAILVLMMALESPQINHSHVVPNDGSIIHETYNGFDGVREASFTPQIASNNPGVVRTFFNRKLSFNVNIPTLRACTLVGGNFARYHTTDVAQLVYKNGEDFVYIYEANNDSVFRGSSLNIPQPVKDALLHSGWYIENHLPDCTLAVWKANATTLCCAMAGMSKDRFIACLADSIN